MSACIYRKHVAKENQRVGLKQTQRGRHIFRQGKNEKDSKDVPDRVLRMIHKNTHTGLNSIRFNHVFAEELGIW